MRLAATSNPRIHFLIVVSSAIQMSLTDRTTVFQK